MSITDCDDCKTYEQCVVKLLTSARKGKARIAELELAVRGVIEGLRSREDCYPQTIALLEDVLEGRDK